MTATTMEAGPVVDLATADSDTASEYIIDRVAGVKNTAKYYATKAWQSIRRGISWIWAKVKQGASWLWNKITVSARWIREKGGQAFRWSRDKLGAGARWIEHSLPIWLDKFWIGTKTFFRGLTWPVRFAFGTTAGLATLLLVGNTATIFLVSGWILVLLLSNRLVMKDPNEIKLVRVNDALADGVGRRITEYQEIFEGEEAENNRALKSEYAGRIHMLNERKAGNMQDAQSMLKAFRKKATRRYTARGANEKFDWDSVLNGMVSESAWFTEVQAIPLPGDVEVI